MRTRRSQALLFPLAFAAAVAAACAFPPLERVRETRPGEAIDASGSVAIDGILVTPADIRPGERVTLRDPVEADPAQPAPSYYWDACAGTLPSGVAGYGPEVTWTAPDQPGAYAVTLNITRAPRDRPSRVLRLCVVAEGEGTCPPASAHPTLSAVSATPDSFKQEQECGGPCASTVEAGVESADSAAVRFRWTVRRGEIQGSGPRVVWRLPMVGCCAETFTVAVTACGARGAAATGFTHVVVLPE